MCKMTGHVYLVDGGVQNDHAQQGPLKVNTACWEGSCRKRSPDDIHTLPTRSGLHGWRRRREEVVVSVWLLHSMLYHGVL